MDLGDGVRAPMTAASQANRARVAATLEGIGRA
jgi:hypothetical protein